jgi:hypothetical protein
LVVGVEIVPEAIEDAKLNSTLNGNIEDTFYTYLFEKSCSDNRNTLQTQLQENIFKI